MFMDSIKKWEQFSIFLLIVLIYIGFFLKSISISLLILFFGILIQILIFYLYKKQNLMGDFIKNKIGAILTGIILIGFFLIKNSGGF